MNRTIEYDACNWKSEVEGLPAERYVVVNADDLGLSRGTNDGILQAHANGVVTSASLMVRQPAATDAAERARVYPHLGLGLHVDLGEWTYCEGQWRTVYEVVRVDSDTEVSVEIERQLDQFCRLVGRQPTHLDSHQHAHRYEPVRSVMIRLAERVGVPLRDFAPYVQYRGDFYGQSHKGESLPAAISAESLVELLESLRAGVTEIGCHPGLDDELPTMYARERRQEVAALCDAGVQAAARRLRIRFVSFTDVCTLRRFT
jgi:chitin disaccharide deacetylase